MSTTIQDSVFNMQNHNTAAITALAEASTAHALALTKIAESLISAPAPTYGVYIAASSDDKKSMPVQKKDKNNVS